MNNLLLYFFCLIFLLFSCVIKGNRLKKISAFIAVFFILYLFYTSINAVDSVNYKFTFDNPKYLTDKIFYFFTSSIKWIFNDYKIYRVLIGAISILPIIFISLKEGGNKCLCFVISMFMLFPMFQNIVTLRNSLATAFVIYGFYYLFKNDDTLKTYIVTISLIIFSAQIHSSMYLYLAILAVYYMITKMKVNYLIILLLCFFLGFMTRSNMMLSLFSSVIPIDKLGYMAGINELGFGFLLTVAFQLSYFLILKKSVSNMISLDIISEFDIKIYNFNKALLCIMPLYMINVLFLRIIRNVLFFEYIVVYKNNKSCLIYKRKELLLLFLLNIILIFIDAAGYESIISILF